MKSNKFRMGLAVLLCLVGGCSANTQRPNWFNPGPTGYQRYNATHGADPYPLPDLGPEVVGGRPPTFQNPVPDVERARQYDNRARISTLPAPFAAPQAPVYAAPAYPATTYQTPTYTAPPVYQQPY